MSRLVFILFAIFSINVNAATNKTGATVDWGYVGNKGPALWAQLNPDFKLCASGKHQSPINIPRKVRRADNALAIHYHPATVYIVEDGLTELQLGSQQTIIRDGHGIQINFQKNTVPEMATYAGNDYRLVQFHFHTPGETEWRKQSYPAEIHFVHQGKNGKALVIAVLVKAGAPSREMQNIIDHLPADHGQEHKMEPINPVSLLPENKHRYYSFAGSLTTPPCTEEGMQWVVMADTITASSAQIMLLRQAIGGPNARPVQPLNKRRVFLEG